MQLLRFEYDDKLDDNTFSHKKVLTNYMKIMKEGYNYNILVAISFQADLVWYIHTTLARKTSGKVGFEILVRFKGGLQTITSCLAVRGRFGSIVQSFNTSATICWHFTTLLQVV